MTSARAQEGFEAFLAGKNQRDNPFESPHARFQWESGWLDAQTEVEFLARTWGCDQQAAIRKLTTEVEFLARTWGCDQQAAIRKVARCWYP